MNFFRNLSDSAVISGLKKAVDEERRKMAEVLEYLREMDRRRLYATTKAHSLWQYCRDELEYSEGAATRRINAMKLLRELPELKGDLISGRQNLSTLVEAQKFFNLEKKVMKLTIDEKRDVLRSIEDLSVRDAKKKLIAMSSFPVEMARPEKERAIDNEHTELTIVVDAKLLKKLSRIRALRSNASPNMKYAELLEFMADETLKSLERPPKSRKSPPTSAVDVSEKSPPTSAVAPLIKPPSVPTAISSEKSPPTSAVNHMRRPIPAALRRQIRAPGLCGFSDPKTGEICGSTYFLEIDHIQPIALGGDNAPENLRLRCRAHNQRRAFEQGLLKNPKN